VQRMTNVTQKMLRALSFLAGHARGPRTLRAHVDSVTRHGAAGWAVDTSRPGSRLSVEALLEGRRIAVAVADQPRPDLRAQGLGDGGNGFQLDFPPGLVPGDPAANVTVRLVETGEILFPRKKKAATTKKPVVGLFETVTDSLVVSGWAAKPGEAQHRCRIEVLVDGGRVAGGVADLFRADLLAAGRGDGGHAFYIDLPAGSLTRPGQEVDVLADGHRLPRAEGKPDVLRLLRPNLSRIRDGRLRVRLPHAPGPVTRATILVNGAPAGDLDWPQGALRVDWCVPAALQDGRFRLFQAVVTAAGLTLASEPRILRAPDYRFEVLMATPGAFSARVRRRDARRSPRVGLFRDTVCLARGRAEPGAGPQADCLVEAAFTPPLAGDRLGLALRDLESGATVAEVTVFHKRQALTDLAALARAGDPTTAPALLGALTAEAAGAARDVETVFAATPPPLPGPSEAEAREVAVVVPVYGGPEETAACLESLLAARNDTPCRVYILDDASPDPAIRDQLDALAGQDRPGWQILRLPVNRGFTRTANIGLVLAGGRDVVLLNADTLVTDGWLDRLRAASREPGAGTVTPFSNNGEICTVPAICTSRPLTDPELIGRLAATAATRNAGQTADIPVGVGFCLYIRRDCLDAVGLLDEASWGKGYGEETDFCLKAAARGFRNLLAADCFVVHRGEVSFGPQKRARLQEAARLIAERYPFYDAHIRRYIREDPLKIYRQAVSLGLLVDRLPPQRVLHVIHGYAGGTERYMRDVAALERQEGLVPLVLRHDHHNERVCLVVEVADETLLGLYSAPHVERYDAASGQALRRAVELVAPQSVHLHAPFGISLDLLDWLADHYPLDITVHDYAWLCPRVTLTDGQGRYCREPGPEGCRACLAATPCHPGLAHHLMAAGGAIETYRQGFRDLFDKARTIVAGSQDVAARLARHGFTAPVTVRPHAETGAEVSPAPRAPRNDGQVRVVLFGGLSRIKGADVLRDCARYAQDQNLPLHFVLIGYPEEADLLDGLSNVSITGRYREEDLPGLVAAWRPDVAFFPAQWPETFSYTLSHAFRLGLWPVVSDIGALAERVRDSGQGVVYPLEAGPDVLCRLLLEQAEDRMVHMRRT